MLRTSRLDKTRQDQTRKGIWKRDGEVGRQLGRYIFMKNSYFIRPQRTEANIT